MGGNANIFIMRRGGEKYQQPRVWVGCWVCLFGVLCVIPAIYICNLVAGVVGGGGAGWALPGAHKPRPTEPPAGRVSLTAAGASPCKEEQGKLPTRLQDRAVKLSINILAKLSVFCKNSLSLS